MVKNWSKLVKKELNMVENGRKLVENDLQLVQNSRNIGFHVVENWSKVG
jgi:hypothetical protein